jgi:methylated-DNA-protein-cysteine methyltransferase-like protein
VPAAPRFAAKVYAIVACIPPGKVTTYGRIARTIGDPRGARMVGWALMDAIHDGDLPCHRVVNRVGFLSGGWHFGHPEVMKGLLLDEGVPFLDEYQVDLRQAAWDPWNDPRALAAADRVDNFDLVAIAEKSVIERTPRDDVAIELDDDHTTS